MSQLQTVALGDAAKVGVAAFICTALVAAGLAGIHEFVPGTTGKLARYGILALLSGLPALIYGIRQGSKAQPTVGFMWLLAGTSCAGVATYLFGVSFYITYPADFLMWSETDFVNDILKFRAGYPIFSAEANNESYTYTPGSQLVTYLLASLTGQSTSLPAMRAIQLVYTLAAVVIAMHTTKRLITLGTGPNDNTSPLQFNISKAAEITLFGLLFLFATNSLTNPFIFNLHNDALAQLVSIAAFALLVEYAHSRDRKILIAMLFVPAVGFLVKQNLALWGGYYCVYLLLLDRPRSLKRVILYGGIAFVMLCAAIGVCYLAWGDDFTYWTFYVLSKHKSVPVRSVQHLIDVRAYLILGFAGAAMLMRPRNFNRMFGLWFVWLIVMLLAIYTGGINFMRHHMGPASLIAGIWFIAGLLHTLPASEVENAERFRFEAWVRGAIAASAALLLAGSGLGILRTPKPPLHADAYRYLAAIDAEFAGMDPADVLLDLGSYIYLDSNTVMKDRASPIGERGSTDTGDLSAVIERFDRQAYSKLLLRNYGSDNFWYDHPSWPKASGIQTLLDARYEVVRRIPAVAEPQSLWSRTAPYGFGEISVLVPRTGFAPAPSKESATD